MPHRDSLCLSSLTTIVTSDIMLPNNKTGSKSVHYSWEACNLLRGLGENNRKGLFLLATFVLVYLFPPCSTVEINNVGRSVSANDSQPTPNTTERNIRVSRFITNRREGRLTFPTVAIHHLGEKAFISIYGINAQSVHSNVTAIFQHRIMSPSQRVRVINPHL